MSSKFSYFLTPPHFPSIPPPAPYFSALSRALVCFGLSSLYKGTQVAGMPNIFEQTHAFKIHSKSDFQKVFHPQNWILKGVKQTRTS